MQEKAAQAQEKAREFLDGAQGNAVVRKARALVSGDAQFFSSQPKLDQIRKQLESDSLGEKKEGMKRVIAQICKGQDMSTLFPDVVKNILVPSIELRKLVYYFIVHYAEDRPNEALLSVSAFQKDLVDTSMHVRSLALRILGSIRITAIAPVVMIAIKKGVADMMPIVRKAAAVGLAKSYSVNKEEAEESIYPMLEQLLGDRSPEVIGAAAFSFKQVAANRSDLIHKHYRKICRCIVDMDEWGQVMACDMLLRYARSQFVNPAAAAKPKTGTAPTADDDSDNDTDSTASSEGVMGLDLDSDHRLLLQSVKPLFLSMNRAVVLSAVAVYFHVAPVAELDLVVKPLIRLLTSNTEGSFVILSTIYSIMTVKPSALSHYIKEFYIVGEDPVMVREVKIRILAKLITRENMHLVLKEFRTYVRSYDMKKVVIAISGLGLIAGSLPETGPAIMRIIAPMLSHKNPEVVTECVIVLRQLVVQSTDKSQVSKIIHKLLSGVVKGDITAPTARAAILWLVGENIHTHVSIAKAAPDCFRTFLKTFGSEPTEVRRQVLTLGTKLWLHLEGEGDLALRFKQQFLHLLELVRFDSDYEVRDRGRVVECALDRASPSFALLKAATLAPRPPPRQSDPYAERTKFQLGSISHLNGTAFIGYQPLPDWPETMPEPTARDPKQAEQEKSDDSVTESESSAASESESSESDDSDSDAGSESDKASTSGSGSGSDDDAPKGKKAPPAKVAPKKVVAKVVVHHKPASPVHDKVVEGLFGAKKDRHQDPTATPPPAATEAPADKKKKSQTPPSSEGEKEDPAKPPGDDFFGDDE
jgi:AP-3 complex subunit beta